ncbi:MAG: family 16 glycosylhydrolase [Ruminococcus sp.]|nr:family 16 glycosylhydrolase [Ruminococcus sp.]
MTAYTMKRLLSAALAAALCTALPQPTQESAAEEVFFEDFSGSSLDTEKWLIAEKNWGGTVTENGTAVDYNGGVTAENVRVEDGRLILTGLGNDYTGELRGIARDGSRRSDGKRCGGAVATRDYTASGSYEIRAKIAPELGCCSAMWTFEYEEDYSGGELSVTNHEIDIEFPGRDESGGFSLSHALCTTWTTEEDYLTQSVDCGEQADGQFHTYRFDWHTGSDTETPRVEFYFDGELTYTSFQHIPTNESRFWLGLWFPKNWAGTPDFDRTEMEVDYVKITPFHESGDTPQNESYPDSGWAQPRAELPKGWLLWHSCSSYGAKDSRLFLRSPEGEIEEITGGFIHPMNASFGSSPDRIVFMAIDPEADEWDIFLREKGVIKNLTKNSGSRNEDPKLSPDGKSVLFKSGHWSNEAGGFVYDLALLDIASGAAAMLTDDEAEEAMPCFSADGRYIYFTRYENRIGSVCRMDLASDELITVYSEEGVDAYYPAVSGEKLYFAKWYSTKDRCDQIMCFDGSRIMAMPFNSPDYDCSDPCPAGEGLIFSSTKNGSYDLYLWDGTSALPLSELNTDLNELGAAFFPEKSSLPGDVNADGAFSIADLVAMQSWLLARPGSELADWQAGDLCQDGRINVFDLVLMRDMLTEN